MNGFAIAQRAGDIRDAGHAAKPVRKIKTQGRRTLSALPRKDFD
jgi:hypothetical protein